MSASTFEADRRMIACAKDIYDTFADTLGPIKCGMDVGSSLRRIRAMQSSALVVCLKERPINSQCIELLFDVNPEHAHLDLHRLRQDQPKQDESATESEDAERSAPMGLAEASYALTKGFTAPFTCCHPAYHVSPPTW